MRDFKNLTFWQRSHLLVLEIYALTKTSFPKEEMYGLVSQMRRSCSSIPTNIAEGCGRNSKPELKRFFVISTGSCNELEYQLLLARDLGYLDTAIFEKLTSELIEIRKMIYSYTQNV